MSDTMKVTIEDDDGEETEHELPCKMEVCYDCQGHGMVMNASMRNHGYSAEEFNESFDDEEKEHYFRRGGMYDVQCPTCNGKNVLPEVDRDACERDPKLKEILAVWDKQEESRARADAECEAEARMERMMLGEY
jgi:hypothetical protein